MDVKPKQPRGRKSTKTPGVSAAPSAPATVVAEPTTTVAVKKPRPVRAVGGICIPPARARRCFDKLTLNRVIESQLAPIKVSLRTYEGAKTILTSGTVKHTETRGEGADATTVVVDRPITDVERGNYQGMVNELEPKLEELRQRQQALGRAKSRFSNSACIATSVVLDMIGAELALHAMKSATVAKKKIIKVEHVHAPGVESLPLFTLYSCLPSWQANSTRVAAEARASELEELTKKIRAECEKEIYKRCPAAKPKRGKKEESPAETPVAAPESAAETAAEPEAELSPEDKYSFTYYIFDVCHNVSKDHPEFAQGKIRISTEFREYMSTLMKEFIHRFSPLVFLAINDMKISTINSTVVLRALQKLLVDGVNYSETLSFETVMEPNAEALKKARASGADLSTVPQDAVLVANRKVEFHSPSYDALRSNIEEKVEQHRLKKKAERDAALAKKASAAESTAAGTAAPSTATAETPAATVPTTMATGGVVQSQPLAAASQGVAVGV